MNPPSALYGAMNKERKPFTYTPGGIDLSEIKSERMAQRLMRNAMSEGVPETTVQNIKSQPTQLNYSAIPNFNCLPVQVFPTFPLPANPKSLLRTRSNPDPPKEPPIKTEKPYILDNKLNADPWVNVNKPSLNNTNNINNSVSVNDYKTTSNNLSNYGSDGHTQILLPEKSYDAEYFVLEPEGNIKALNNNTNKIEDNIPLYCTKPLSNIDMAVEIGTDNEKEPVVLTSSSPQDITTNNFEQKEIKIVKKQSKTENELDQNGNTEAAIVVKLPSKKSSAKTETKVEVLKKILPDGTIEEIKTTITKTTIDGKTEIKTETETRILPKEEAEGIVEVEEEEEEEEEETEDVDVEQNENEDEVVESSATFQQPNENIQQTTVKIKENEIKENGHIINGEENVEICTTKNVVVTQSVEQDSEEELEQEDEEVGEQEEEVEEDKEDGNVEVEQVIILKKQDDKLIEKADNAEIDEEIEITEVEKEDEVNEKDEGLVEEEDVEDEEESAKAEVTNEVENEEEKEEIEAEEDEQNEEVEEEEQDENIEQSQEDETTSNRSEDKREEHGEDEDVKIEDAPIKTNSSENIMNDVVDKSTESTIKEEDKQLEETSESNEKAPPRVSFAEDSIKKDTTEQQLKEELNEQVHKITLESEPKVSFREPSIPLEKVEDIEIKPIGPAQEIIKKCHTEIISTTKDEPSGALSTQTEYNRIENIVTVNRTTKTLDNTYELAEHTIPTLKTYFVPHNDRILSTPQPISKTFQPVYTPEPQTERRHSLLLDRLSVERQIPVQHPDIYQNSYQFNNQSYEQNQWLQEPQSEVVTVSNVKPSTITKNQQWYQQSKREESVTSNIVTPTPIMPSQQLSQAQPQVQPQPQVQLQPQPQVQAQPPYQSYAPPQYTPKSEFQPTYVDSSKQNSFKSTSTNFQQNIYPSYTPKPSWVSSTFDTKPAAPNLNQYSTLKTEPNESYLKPTQPFSSTYVPPPWEQDSSYAVENQNLYQPIPPTPVYTPSVNQTWKPKEPESKFSKPTPTAYIPPAPNQSFVKPVTNVEPNVLPGRKTYYSEYERRYISVPESTYIPSETKFRAQPDPSPQYYYDNNEPSETVEPQWRKELREFTEKTSQSTIQTEKISVRPPWEEDPKYSAPEPSVTPTWTQTLRPRTWRERSYEPEYIGSKEWPKTNTIGRGRPHSSYIKSNVNTTQERSRGVSVDRYNPNNYQPPISAEHPPVQSHTLNPNIHPKTYHNPSVPAYHARTSAEPREQVAPYTQRTWVDARAPPVQSRSFKYLQWITGTED